jgi:hypothetical protein
MMASMGIAYAGNDGISAYFLVCFLLSSSRDPGPGCSVFVVATEGILLLVTMMPMFSRQKAPCIRTSPWKFL